MNIQDFLAHRDVEFEIIPHEETFDSHHLARATQVPGQEVAKTVLLRADHGFAYYVAVLPATRRVDLGRLGHCLADCHLELASEAEVVKHCPDCEAGVLPPFGSQIGPRTLMDESLLEDASIVFEGNNHHEAIRMRMADFREIEQPLVCPFGS